MGPLLGQTQRKCLSMFALRLGLLISALGSRRVVVISEDLVVSADDVAH